MSRRRNDNGDVRGPTSALTSFLKDKGIRSRNIRNGWSRREDAEGTPVAGPSTPTIAEEDGPPSAPRSGSSTPARQPSLSMQGDGSRESVDPDETEDEGRPAFNRVSDSTDVDVDMLEDDLEEGSTRVASTSTSTTVRVRKSIKASTSKETVEATTSTSIKRKATVSTATKKKKKKDDDDDDEYSDEERDGVMRIAAAPKARYAERKPGSFAMCAECNKKFTVTRYTNPHPEIAGGLLCGPCDKEIGPGISAGINKGSSVAASAAKKKGRAVKNKVVLNKDKPTVTSLTKCCIEVIGKAIEDVEELGDIGAANYDKVCQIVCKNRDLTLETVKLFVDVENRSLKLYDCTRLEPEGLRMLANHCPNLEELKLFQCGFMDNETILHYATRLKKLKHLQLYGAFLVRKEAWKEFFEILENDVRGLEGFMLRLSTRIDNSVVTSLVRTCPNLTHLQLAEMGCLDDSSLALLQPLKHLKFLDLSHGGLTGTSYTDDGIIPLLESTGASLNTLILDDNILLTDRTLIEGIKVNCTELIEISLRNLDELLPTGIAELFSEDWVNQKGMVRLNFHRCTQLDDQALEAVIRHSGKSVVKLDLNSVDAVTEQGLKYLAENCPNLVELDISFVREVDDFILKNCLERLTALKKVYIYGDNRISDLCPSKQGVKILGHEQGVVSFD